MQILLGAIAGAVVGLALHFVLAGRSARGVALAPMTGAVVSAVVWTALTWLGIGIDNPWIWLSSVVSPALVLTPALLLATRIREQRDLREKQRLGID